jgi:DNA-binding transcriptional MerR regulator
MALASPSSDVVHAGVEIPKRALFKAGEVCEIASVQPYVLRSWESEFPDLGVARTAGGPRMYRRADVERVLRIKHLVFGEGLTLAGARRRLGEDPAPAAEGELPFEELLGLNARERVAEVKRGLRLLLDLLSVDGQPVESALEHQLATLGAAKVARPSVARASKSAARGSRKKPAASRSTGRR